MGKERRQSKRIPLGLSVAEPIRLELSTPKYEGAIPGVLVNISSGGIALLIFHEIPLGHEIEFGLGFLGLEEKVTGKVVREDKRHNETFIVGVEFTRRSPELKDMLEKMAEDNDICEFRVLTDIKNACFPECSFSKLCAKRIKKNF
ncbi:MAG: PilZ domain-containing protein [Elusimicrobia bacterium]|nr:PilZ domain-containing protein [Elusimicrobiota bacterium]